MSDDLARLLTDAAERLAETLQAQNVQLVLAESCTGGLASATLAGIPGISEYLCGSAVVYQVATKEAWLHVTPDLIREHDVVSEPVAVAMSAGALTLTQQARVAAAITGHLGPDAPEERDGLACVACMARDGRQQAHTFDLFPASSKAPAGDRALRLRRQQQAARFLLEFTNDFLLQESDDESD